MSLVDVLRLSVYELKRLQIIKEVIDKLITQKLAESIIGVSHRQTKRRVWAVRPSGAHGVIHKATGKPSNRRRPKGMKSTFLALYRERYHDFWPTFACEKLFCNASHRC
jgi:hypothetical protein